MTDKEYNGYEQGIHIMVKDEIVTKSGRVFRPGNKELLENIPSDIVQEMAKRKWEEIKRSQENKE